MRDPSIPPPSSVRAHASQHAAGLDWDAALHRAAALTGTVALIGPPDSGKSTFALALANRLAEAGRPAAVIDADVGQSEIGPPGAIGMARVERPVGALSEVRVRGLAFGGDISPFGHLMPVTLGTLLLLR